MSCPTGCDDYCDSDCHESHQVRAKRLHNPETCPGATGVLDETDLPTLRKMQGQLTHQAETRPFPARFVARVLAAYFRRLAERVEDQS